MAIHSSIRVWEIPWTEEPGGLHGVTESDTAEATSHVKFLSILHAQSITQNLPKHFTPIKTAN